MSASTPQPALPFMQQPPRRRFDVPIVAQAVRAADDDAGDTHHEGQPTAMQNRTQPDRESATAIARTSQNDSNLATYDAPLRPADVARQVALVQDVMRSVMREGEHYGRIPGCGKKPALLKSGGEKLAMTFRLAPDYDISIIELGGGHREYRVCCRLVHIPTGEMRGQGWGSCSTMESKYRYRYSDTKIVDREVPGRYWQLKKQGKHREAAEFLPAGCRVMKQHDDSWAIVKSEKIENPDIADCYNTVLKIANKRALLAALLTATAASDIFAMSDFGTEDDDDDDAPLPTGDDAVPPAHGDRHEDPAPAAPSGQGDGSATDFSATLVLGEAGAERLKARLREVGATFDDALAIVKQRDDGAFQAAYGVELADLPASTLPAIKAAIDAIAADTTPADPPAAEPTPGQFNF